MHFENEREWAEALVASIDDQADAIAKLPRRTPAERKLVATLNRKVAELKTYARSVLNAAELKEIKRENEELRRALKRQGQHRFNAEARA